MIAKQNEFLKSNTVHGKKELRNEKLEFNINFKVARNQKSFMIRKKFKLN